MKPSRRVWVAVLSAALGAGLVSGAVAAFVKPGAGGPSASQNRTPPPSGRDSTPPTTPTTHTSTPKPVATKLTDLELDPGKVGRVEFGAPYWNRSARAIISGETKFPFAAELGTFVDLDSSYAVLTPEEPSRIVLVDDTGSHELDKGQLSGPVSSADRSRVAWTVASRDGGDATLVVADSITGKPIYRVAIGNAVSGVVGFLGDRVAVTTSEETPLLIDPATGKKTFLKSETVLATAPGAGLIAVGTKKGDDPGGDGKPGELCTAILDGPDGDEVWKSCDLTPIGFSPNGRYVVTHPPDTDGTGWVTTYTIIDLRTDRPVQRLRADFLGGVAWEQGSQAFTLEAARGRKLGLIRCEITGACTSVVEPVKFAGGAGESVYYDYQLASN